VLAAAALAAISVALAEALTGGTARSHRGARHVAHARPVRSVRRRVLLGRSANGRPIVAVELGDRRAPTALLVVGCIHGNEPAGAGVARLLEAQPPTGVHVWVVESLNPDGVAAGTRENAQGVDLNRNFPWRWRPIPRGGGQYSGPRALYAPEARIAYRLVLRARPRVTVWFHQPLDVVDRSGGDAAIERRFARLAGMRETTLTRYPGSAAGWQNHRLPGTTAFVVELPRGPLPAALSTRLARALASVARD
jgi:protein MpaA